MQGGYAQRDYGNAVTNWENPTYICLKLPKTYDNPSIGRKEVLDNFNSFKRRKVKPDKEWLDKIHSPEFVTHIKNEYLNKNHGVPMHEFLDSWILGRHSIYQEDGKWRVHIDMLANARYIPSGKCGESNQLGAIWEKSGGEKDTVQIMRVRDKHDGFRTRTAILKTLAYVTDKLSCDDPEALVDYHFSTKGERRSITGGNLHGNSLDKDDRDTVELRCAHCGSSDLRDTGYASRRPKDSKDAHLFVNGARVIRGCKFKFPPPD